MHVEIVEIWLFFLLAWKFIDKKVSWLPKQNDHLVQSDVNVLKYDL